MPQARPKRVPRTSRTVSGSGGGPERAALADGALQHERGDRGDDARERGHQQQPLEARRERARDDADAPPADQEEDQRAEAERDRPVLDAAGDGERGVGDRAGLAAGGEQLVERLGGRGRLADGEDEAARDRVAVGRHDPVGRGVGAVAEPGLELDRDLRALAARMERLAGLDLLALGVEDPQRAEARLDRLVEAERDRGGRLVELGPALGDGRLQRRVGERGGREQGERRDERGERREGASHHASTTSFLGGGGASSSVAWIIGVAAAADHEDREREHDQQRGEGEDRGERQAALVERDPRQRARDRALGAGDLDRHGPVVDLGLDVLVLEVGRVALAHPVRAVVVPLEARALGQLLPLRLGAEVGRHRRLAEAVLVEVVGLGVRVDLDRAVLEQLGVRLRRVRVVVDRDVLAARVVHEQAVVEVQDRDVDALGRGRDRGDERAIVAGCPDGREPRGRRAAGRPPRRRR